MPNTLRILRWLFHSAVIVSLVAGMAFTILWMTAVARGSFLLSRFGSIGVELITERREFRVLFYRDFPIAKPLEFWRGNSSRRYQVPGFSFTGEGGSLTFDVLGLRKYWGYTNYTPLSGQGIRTTYWQGFNVPSWMMIVPHWILPVYWIAVPYRRHRRLKLRQRLNLCEICGYDLRATVERCPECGHPIGNGGLKR